MNRRGSYSSPDRWLLLSTRSPARGEELLMIDALRRLGARSVERVGQRLVARLPPPEDVGLLLREAEAAIRGATTLDVLDLAWEWQPHEEWAVLWRAHLQARRITARISVAPAGSEPQSRTGELMIRLEPGTAFGTAEHATTRACLRFLERLLEPGDRIVDIGAGSGILSIAAALLGARRVLALELDPWSCAVARENITSNAVTDRVEVREVEVDHRRLRRLGRCDGVLANLEAHTLLSLLPGIGAALARDGWLIASGVTRGERADVLRAARVAGLGLREEDVDDGWWTGWLAHLG